MSGYYIDSTNDEYYEGPRRNIADEEVPARASDLLDWSAGDWVYNLDRCKASAKKKVTAACDAHLFSLMSAGDAAVIDLLVSCIAGYETAFIAGTPAATSSQCPMLNGWAQQMGGGATRVDAAVEAEVFILGASAIGSVAAYKADLFAQINAASTGEDAIAVVFDGGDVYSGA